MKEECFHRIIPMDEGHFRRAVTEFVAHYRRESNHQGLENALIEGAPRSGAAECTANHASVDCSTSTSAQRNRLDRARLRDGTERASVGQSNVM
jgi:hypothetical protein